MKITKKIMLIVIILITQIVFAQNQTGEIERGNNPDSIKQIEINNSKTVEKYYLAMKEYYGKNCPSQFDELFKFWAEYSLVKPLSKKERKLFFENYSDEQKKKFIYLTWLIKQKYPMKTAKLNYKIDEVKKDETLQHIAFVSFIPPSLINFDRSEPDHQNKTYAIKALSPIYAFGKVTQVKKTFHNGIGNKTPISIDIMEVIGPNNSIKNSCVPSMV